MTEFTPAALSERRKLVKNETRHSVVVATALSTMDTDYIGMGSD